MAQLMIEITPEDEHGEVSRFDFKLAFEELFLDFRRGERSGSGEFFPTNGNGTFTYSWSTEGENLRHTHPF